MEFKYELYDITAIKNENQLSMEQDIKFLDQNDTFSSTEYGLQLVNDKSYCNLICNEHGDCQKRSTFQKELPLDIDFHSPYVLGTMYKIPSVIKQTIFNNKNRQNLEHSSAFKPVYRQHHDISEKTLRINNTKQHNMEYLSAFKPVYHSTHIERDEVKDIINIRQKIKHNSAFKVFNAYSTENIRGISNNRQNQSYSSAFKPVYHSTQNSYDEITGIDYKRKRLNDNISSSYQGENAENFLNYTTAQQINQSNMGTWVDVSHNFSNQQVSEVNSSNKIYDTQNYTSYTENLVSNNDIAVLLMRQIDAIETNNKLLKEIILTKYSASNKDN